MTYLELVQQAMKEAGITSTNPAPGTLVGVTGIVDRFKGWVSQAWLDIQLENDDSEFRKSWFSTTLNPRFYFDLAATDWIEAPVASVIEGDVTGATFTVTSVIILNGGLFSDGTAQGFIEFTNPTGAPMIRENLRIQGTNTYVGRFVKWGDYRLTDQDEMGVSYISDLEDIWWESLKIQSIPGPNENLMNETPLPYMDYSKFMQSYDTGMLTPGRPIYVTETPDDGVRLAFYPPLDKPYSIQGFYIRDVTQLINDDDTPEELKQLYHPMIFWRAVMYYGQYEMQPAIQQEAQTRYTVYKKRLDREGDLPVVFRPMRMYDYGYY